jgi:hypothetical protein
MLTRLARRPSFVFVGVALLVGAAAACWASGMLGLDVLWIPSFCLAVIGALATAVSMLFYGRQQSPKLGLLGGVGFLGAAVLFIAVALWGRPLWWAGLVILLLLVPVFVGADRFNQK